MTTYQPPEPVRRLLDPVGPMSSAQVAVLLAELTEPMLLELPPPCWDSAVNGETGCPLRAGHDGDHTYRPWTYMERELEHARQAAQAEAEARQDRETVVSEAQARQAAELQEEHRRHLLWEIHAHHLDRARKLLAGLDAEEAAGEAEWLPEDRAELVKIHALVAQAAAAGTVFGGPQ